MFSFYTGIGSRETPIEIASLISRYTKYLAHKGYGLRSGGANGADSFFQNACDGPMQIFLPWNGFNGFRHNPDQGFYNVQLFENYVEAEDIASCFHPHWRQLKPPVRALHTRNVYQVLGPDLQHPSISVICWALPETTRAKTGVKGGTGLAVRLAHSYNIPIFNLYFSTLQQKVEAILNKPWIF
jgi:hypothetical protein